MIFHFLVKCTFVWRFCFSFTGFIVILFWISFRDILRIKFQSSIAIITLQDIIVSTVKSLSLTTLHLIWLSCVRFFSWHVSNISLPPKFLGLLSFLIKTKYWFEMCIQVFESRKEPSFYSWDVYRIWRGPDSKERTFYSFLLWILEPNGYQNSNQTTSTRKKFRTLHDRDFWRISNNCRL